MLIKTCANCGKEYLLGYTGVEDSCDKCAGVKRDKDGFAWFDGEKSQLRIDVLAKRTFTVTREEAFTK